MLEVLDTPNAIATYNILVQEGRQVAAALLLPSSVDLCDESETNSTTCNESFTTFVHRTHASRVSRVIVCSLLRTMVDLASASTNNFAASTRDAVRK